MEMIELSPVRKMVNMSQRSAYEEGIFRDGSETIHLKSISFPAVQKKLKEGDLEDLEDKKVLMNEAEGFEKYPLDALDPTQRCFADRVLKWAGDVVDAYQEWISGSVSRSWKNSE